MHPFDSYRIAGKKALPIRALSPNHGDELSREYFELILERAKRYGFNQIHFANNPIENDLDQFIHYEKTPGLEAAIIKTLQAGEKAAPPSMAEGDRRKGPAPDRSHVAGRVELFKWFTREAKAAGLETFIWHHEINYPEELAALHPEGFHSGKTHSFPGDTKMPPPNLESPVLWDFITHRFEEAYAALPDLSGIILTMQESDIPIYHLMEDPKERVHWTRKMYDHINAVHKRLKRKWILRTFAWREWEYSTVFQALQGFDPEVVVEMKAEPMDWQMFYPHEWMTSKLADRKKVVEMDLGGNFWGECEIPSVSALHYAGQIKFAAEHGCLGAVLRCDRSGGHTFDKPMEANVAVAAELLKNPNADALAVERAWLEKTYGEAQAEAVKEICDIGWEVTKRMYFVDGSFFFHHLYWNAIRGNCNLWVAERDLLFEPGDLGFRREIELSELYVTRAEKRLATVLKTVDEKIPAEQPATRHHQVKPAPGPFAELARQVKNLREYHDFFSALKETVYSIKCEVYERSEDARARSLKLVSLVGRLLKKSPHLMKNQPKFLDHLRYVVKKIAEREIQAGRHFSSGTAFHGKSYAMPYPELLKASLPVNPKEQNILVVFMGTHMCREVVCDVLVNNKVFELRRGTMSWFWAYDGYKRGEIELPADICKSGEIEVVIRSKSADSAPFISEVRTEVEFEGYRPRKDT
ncbi:MAG TPA: hypothetical protein VL860_08835 [Planctomycetota bacterium]|nr:hypothetical protein [Planctomycetota bacterium]